MPAAPSIAPGPSVRRTVRSRWRQIAPFAFALWLAPGLLAAAPSFPHEQSDLRPDPAARFGKLANGVRYVIQPNREPRGRVSLRLLILAGSFHEAEQERGLAHFLEHLAFSGSRHYAPGTLVEYFQRMGMRFGGDTNANTGSERTVYILELPDARSETLTEGLRVFSDYAGGLILAPESVEKERGIILSERRVRDSVETRAFQALREATLGDTLMGRRLPIGSAAVIQEAPRERLVAFWDAWYRPERMVVIAVGDFEPDPVEREIATWMSPLTARARARPEPELGRVTSFTGIRALFLPDPEAPATTVTFLSQTPIQRQPDTLAGRRQEYARLLAFNMLAGRLGGMARGANSPISRASARAVDAFGVFREAHLQLVGKPESWRQALILGEVELRRALEFGFTASELKTAIAVQTRGIAQLNTGANTRASRLLADGIATSLVNRRVWMSPADIAARLQPELEAVTLEECAAAFRSAFDTNGRYVALSGNAPPLAKAPEAILAQHAAATKIPVKARAERATATWAYARSGPAGEVTKREHIADLDLTLVTFANGVRLNVKRTDFEAGRVRFLARVGHGALTEPPEKRGLAMLATNAFLAAGLKQHSAPEYRLIFAGRDFNLTFTAPLGDAFLFNGFTSPADFPLHLEVIVAHLTEAGYRPDALPLVQKNFEQLYSRYESTTAGPFAMALPRRLAGNDPRFSPPPKSVLMQRTLAELRTWLEPELARGPVEFSVIGDIEVDAAIAAVAETLGALPPREPRIDHPELRQASLPNDPFHASYAIYSDIPKGTVALYWPTNTASDIRHHRRLSVLASVLNDALRTKVREQLGATYSPSARYSSYRDFPGISYLSASVDVEPAMAEKIIEVVAAVGEQLARDGVSPDQLHRALVPAQTAARDLLRSNAHLLGAVLARAQQSPESLDWARTYVSDLQEITPEVLTDLARRNFDRARLSTAKILPQAVARKPSATTRSTASTKAVTVPVTDFTGPENTFRDPLHPLSGVLPASWQLRSVQRFGELLTLIIFSDAEQTGLVCSLIHQRYRAAPTFDATGAEGWLRKRPAERIAQRVDRERLVDYQIRPASVTYTTPDRQATLTWLADYLQNGKQRTEYVGMAVHQSHLVTFAAAASSEVIEAMCPSLDRFVASLRLSREDPTSEKQPPPQETVPAESPRP